MTIRLIIACLLVSLGNNSFAQQDSVRQRVSYYNSFVAGTLIGCGECANGKDFTFSFLTLHGIKFPTGVKIALGAGMDVYHDWRLFPLVGSITIDSELRDNAVYVQLNSGYSWGRYIYPLENEIYLRQKGGFVVNPMIGYRVGRGKSRMYIQAGYKFQYANVSYTPAWWWGLPPTITREYDLSRVVVQMGFGFR
ncbi:MAG TPA: hypothetical protein PLV21_11320 [Cyclobacteriaceae bacterium]|nr:hypothetical protein [Cyclobacteriaceae bacterium]HRJ82470.1 hypothetical protein [Cyclobacteriaceae bacterium]